MTASQRRVLVALCELTADKGYPPTEREIARRAGLAHSTIVPLVHDLARQGLVRLTDQRSPRQTRSLNARYCSRYSGAMLP